MDPAGLVFLIFLAICSLLINRWRLQREERARAEQEWRERTIANGVLRAEEARVNAISRLLAEQREEEQRQDEQRRELNARNEQQRHNQRLEKWLQSTESNDFTRLLNKR